MTCFEIVYFGYFMAYCTKLFYIIVLFDIRHSNFNTYYSVFDIVYS